MVVGRSVTSRSYEMLMPVWPAMKLRMSFRLALLNRMADRTELRLSSVGSAARARSRIAWMGGLGRAASARSRSGRSRSAISPCWNALPAAQPTATSRSATSAPRVFSRLLKCDLESAREGPTAPLRSGQPDGPAAPAVDVFHLNRFRGDAHDAVTPLDDSP